MEGVKSLLSGLELRDFWNDSIEEIEITIRVLVCLSLMSLLFLPVILFSGIGVYSPLFFGLGSFYSFLVIIGLKNRSEYGWLALLILCSQSLFSIFFPVGVLLMIWCMRPKFRSHFRLERLK